MALIDSRTGIEIITEDECLRLLGEDEIGRLGVVHGRSPVVLPVNYHFDGHTIVFRTASGTKLDAGPRSPACFEIDSFDRVTKTGWSVLVSGQLEEVNVYEVIGETQLQVRPWSNGKREHWMRLARRASPAESSADTAPRRNRTKVPRPADGGPPGSQR